MVTTHVCDAPRNLVPTQTYESRPKPRRSEHKSTEWSSQSYRTTDSNSFHFTTVVVSSHLCLPLCAVNAFKCCHWTEHYVIHGHRQLMWQGPTSVGLQGMGQKWFSTDHVWRGRSITIQLSYIEFQSQRNKTISYSYTPVTLMTTCLAKKLSNN